MYERIFLSALISFISGLIATRLVIPLASKWGVTAKPKEDRWHKRETPLLGGIGIAFGFIAGTIGVYLILTYDIFDSMGLLACALAMFALGLIDDIKNISPQHKLAGQVFVASIFLFIGNRFQWIGIDAIDIFITLFWIIGITNAINLIDNMDGLAAGISLISCLSMLFLFCFYSSSPQEILPNLILISSLLGSLAAFLVFNFNPAKIFMGDAGSLMVGFLLSTLSIVSQDIYVPKQGIPHVFAIVVTPLLLLMIPILDTTLVSIMRRISGRKISQGGKDHSSHRLVAIGFTEKEAVLILYGFAVISGIMAFLIQFVRPQFAIMILAGYFLSIGFTWLYLARVKVYRETNVTTRNKSSLYGFQFLYKRRVFEVLLDVCLITFSYYAAYLLRFEGDIGPNLDFFLKSLPILIAFQIMWFFYFGVYRGIWERAGLKDLFIYAKAITFGSLSCMLLMVFLYRFQSFSRAVFVIYLGIMLVVFSISRLFFRIVDERILRRNIKGIPTLIYGAGKGGLLALQELEGNGLYGLKIMGFVDDNKELWGKRLEGYPIFGGREALKQLIGLYNIEELIVSFRNPKEIWYEELKQELASISPELRIRRLTIKIE